MKMLNEFWINGVREESVSAADRGLEFGDGLFETMRYYQGNIIALDFHLMRLETGLKRLSFPDSSSRVLSDLKIVIEHLTSLGNENVIVRITVTRGSGARAVRPCPSGRDCGSNPGHFGCPQGITPSVPSSLGLGTRRRLPAPAAPPLRWPAPGFPPRRACPPAP